MQVSILITNLTLTGTAVSLPATAGGGGGDGDKVTPTRTLNKRYDGGDPADTLLVIMPSSSSCANRGVECVTADVAAPYLVDSMADYGVTTGLEQAGVLALIAYESVQLQFKTNQNAEQKALGRGTANEQSGDFNVEYANTFPELKKLNLSTSNVLDYVTPNQYNFATGAWYYSAQDVCADAREMAKNGSTAWEWFSAYMAGCVHVALTLDSYETAPRVAYWNAALDAFHITNDTTNS